MCAGDWVWPKIIESRTLLYSHIVVFNRLGVNTKKEIHGPRVGGSHCCMSGLWRTASETSHQWRFWWSHIWWHVGTGPTVRKNGGGKNEETVVQRKRV